MNFSLGESINTPEKVSLEKKENYNDEDLKVVEQIKKLIDERVKPAVAQDGGDISFVKFDNEGFFRIKGSLLRLSKFYNNQNQALKIC